jgi:hypothetical protein
MRASFASRRSAQDFHDGGIYFADEQTEVDFLVRVGFGGTLVSHFTLGPSS